MSQFGARLAFRVMGIASGAMFIVYGVVYYGYLRKREIKKKKKASNQNEIELNSSNAVSNAAAGSKYILFYEHINRSC